jgi:asparagine synthase (glutamine-hydrolysing)
LENCSLMAASFGVEYVWPLWDSRLVQQWLSTPSIWKVGERGVGRYLHRRAIVGVSADNVAWKSSKDMGCATLQNTLDTASLQPVLENLQAQLRDLPSVLYDIVDVEKVSALAARGLKEQWQGLEKNLALSSNTSSLVALNAWLKPAC